MNNGTKVSPNINVRYSALYAPKNCEIHCKGYPSALNFQKGYNPSLGSLILQFPHVEPPDLFSSTLKKYSNKNLRYSITAFSPKLDRKFGNGIFYFIFKI
jgi:hypothetical protein